MGYGKTGYIQNLWVMGETSGIQGKLDTGEIDRMLEKLTEYGRVSVQARPNP